MKSAAILRNAAWEECDDHLFSVLIDGPYADVTGVTGTSIVVDSGTIASAKFYRLRN